VSSLAKILEQKRVILFRAPPYSGKTSIAQLLENYLVVNNSSELLRVIRVSLLWGSSVGKKCDYDTFCEVWKKIIGVGWYEWVEQCEKIQTVLIMDETQMIYEVKNEDNEDVSMKNAGTAVEFWDTIKECLQGTNLSVIMFAAYGYGTNSAGLSTPLFIPLNNSMGLAELRFTDEELEKYVHSYCAKNFGSSCDDDIVSQFIMYIKHVTVGHVGLVRHILQHTKDALQHRILYDNLTWKRIFEYLNSDNFNGTVDDCRAAPKLSKLSDNQLKICQDVCLKGKIGFNDSVDNKYLIRSGVLVITVIEHQRYLQFAAPLIERSFFQQYYGKETRSMSTPKSLYDFIVKVFKAMSVESVEILNDSLGIGKDKILLEQTWQKEFYRIGTRELGNDYFLSCDVGAYYGSEGYIDFYINGLEWAIELLRIGLDMEKHDRRFDETTGEYKEIVEVAKETAIIDIRSESKKVRKLKKGFVHVSYSENYDAYMIECLGKETVKIETRRPDIHEN
jgi:hypothetical protein